MKKFLIAIVALLGVCPIFAQTPIIEMKQAYTRFIPGMYMKDGQAALYFSFNEYLYDNNGYGEGSDEYYKAEIYNFDLELIKTIDLDKFQPYTKIEEREANGGVSKESYQYDEVGEAAEMPPLSDIEARKSAFANMIYQLNYYKDPNMTLNSLNPIVRNDSILIYFQNQESYPTYGGRIYFRVPGAYLAPTDIYGYFNVYAMEIESYTGPWTTTIHYYEPYRTLTFGRYYDVENINDWNGGLYMPFSQTFFNDDEKFEYLRWIACVDKALDSPVYGESNPLETLFGITANDRDGDGEEDYRSQYYTVYRKGVEVVNEDGEVIYSFVLPNDVSGSVQMNFYKSSNNILAEAKYTWQEEDNSYRHTTIFYRIDKESGIVEKVREMTEMAVSPNPVSKGTPLTIDLPQGIGQRNISLTNMNGSTVYSRCVDTPASRTYVNVDNLAPGLYIFTLTDNGQVTDTYKIIVR